MVRWCSILVIVIAGPGALSACSSTSPGVAKPVGDCPVPPVPVVVSVDQWGDIVRRLAGDCGEVTTIIEGSTADPHDYEPTPSDNAAFDSARLVVMNGLDYDPWVDKALATLDDGPDVVNAGAQVGLRDGANPHIWYGPDYVYEVADAVTKRLRKLAPAATGYLDAQHAAWHASMAPYDAQLAEIAPLAAGKAYGATEGVFDYMAETIGLVNETPTGSRNAAANTSDPGPGDVYEFQRDLGAGAIDVLIFNPQTEGAIPDQIRSDAERSDVPVVDVTETVHPGARSFVSWQVGQLRDLARALAP